MSNDRKLPVSRNSLMEVVKNVLLIIIQFLAELTPKGINQEFRDGFETEIQVAKDRKTESQLDKEASALTVIVKKKCKACYKWGMKVKTYLERRYGKKSAEVNEFPAIFTDLEKEESKMIEVMPQIIALDAKYQSETCKKGREDNFGQQGKDALAELESANKEQTNLATQHDAYRKETNLIFLALYDKVNYINSIGREKFEDDPVNLKYFASPWHKGKGKGGGGNNEPENPTTPPTTPGT